MLKRLRRKFVLVSVASLALVLLVLVIGINAGMRYFNARSADSLLEDMAWHEGEIPRTAPPEHRPWEYPVTEETPFETRYFAVYVDSEGRAEEIKLDFIRAIDEESAVEYTREALESGKRTGYVSRYRFLAYDGENGGSIYFFLDCSRQLWTQKVVLLVSCAGSLAVLAATALVLFTLSRKAIAPIAQSVEQQKRFITDAGHELKTPITAIMAAADVLALDDPDDEWVESIQRSGARLAKLTADLIDLSRFDEADPFPDRERFDLSADVESISEDFRLTAQPQGHEVIVDITTGIEVTACREALRRVVGILLDNAMRYSDEGSEVYIKLDKHHSHARLEVRNACAGMTRETLSRMFERFYRGDESRSDAGTGVGLSMARAIVEAHGGTLTAAYGSGEVTLTASIPA